MTTPKHTAPADTDLGDALFALDDARAESDWLLAREHDPDAPAPSAEIASDYAEIEHLLGNLPLPPSDERWHDEVLRAVTAMMRPPRPWWRTAVFQWTTGAGAALAAAVVLFMVVPRTPPELKVVTRHGDATRSDANEVVVGDHLVVTARPDGPADLRVYRSNGTLVARCPNGPACRTQDPGELTIEVTLDVPDQYHVVLVVGMAGALPVGTMDAYLDAATSAGARVVPPRLIDVH